MRESEAAMRKAEKDAERARREENKAIKRYNRAIDKLSCLTQKEWESPKAYGSRAMKLLGKVDDDDESWVVKKFSKGIDRKEFRRTIRAERDRSKTMTLAAAADMLRILYKQADDTDYVSDSDSESDDGNKRACIRIYPRSDNSQFWTENSDSGDLDEEQLLYLLRDFRSNAVQSPRADYVEEMNIDSKHQPAFEQTTCGNADNAGVDPEVPSSPCDGINHELETEPGVENRKTMVTAGGLAIAARVLEDRCEQESIRIRIPAFNDAHLAEPHLNALLPDVPVSGYRLETTSMLPVLSNLWDESDKPIVRLPAVPAVNQLLHAQAERLGGAITVKNNAAPFLDSALARPETMRAQLNMVVLEEPITGREVTMQLALPFARTSSEWDPGWKQVGDYTGHGGASAGGVSEHQGNGEEPGVGKEEESGDEKGEAQKLQVTKEGEEGMPGEETSVVKIAGEGGKVVNPEAEGATPKRLHDNPGDTGNHEWDPGQGTAMADDLHETTARAELIPQSQRGSQPERKPKEQLSIQGEQAAIIPLFSWPPPNQVLERYRASEESLARLNLQLQREYSSPELDSRPAKTPIITHEWQPSPESAAADSSATQGVQTVDTTPRWQTPVKNNPPCNPTAGPTCRVIHCDARSGSRSDIGRYERKPLNEWPRVKRWLHTLRAFLWRVEVELQRESGASGGMEWVGRRLWDPGGRHERREACGVASIRELGRSVGL